MLGSVGGAPSAPPLALPDSVLSLEGKDKYTKVGSTTRDRIEINAAVMLGIPVIRGTRIPVELLLRKLADGMTSEELLDAYPTLKKADLQAAIAYAADSIAHEETLPLEGSGKP